MEPNQMPMQPVRPAEAPKSNLKMIIIITVVVLATAGLTGGITWFAMNKKYNNYKTSADKSLATMQKLVNELKATQQTSTISDATSWQTYINSDYNFQLVFGTSWKGYTVKKLSVSGKALAEYAFYLPTSNTTAQAFSISVYNTTDYQSLATNGSSIISIISQGGKSFAYSIASQWPSDWKITKSDVQTVISTFKLN